MLKEIKEIIEQAMITMGKYQIIILDDKQSKALTNVAKTTSEENAIIKKEAQAIEEKVEDIVEEIRDSFPRANASYFEKDY